MHMWGRSRVEIRWAIAALVCACAGASPRSASSSCALDAPREVAHGRTLAWLGEIGAVADADNARVVFFRTGADAAIVRSFETREGPTQILVDAAGRMLVVERGAGTVSAYDPCTGSHLASAAVAADPVAMVMGPDHGTLYVISSWTRTLSELDAATLRTRRTIELARDPRSISMDREGVRLYVTHLAGAPLSVIPLSDELVAEQPHLELPGMSLREVYYNPGGYYGSPRTSERTIARASQHASQAWTAALDPAGRAAIPVLLNRPSQQRAGESFLVGYGGAADNSRELLAPEVFALLVWDPAGPRWSLAFEPDSHAAGSRIRIPSAVATHAESSTLYIASTGTNEIAAVRPGASAPDVDLVPTIFAPSAIETTADGELLVFSQIEHAIEHGPAGARRTLSIGEDPLDPQIALGRRLFFTANDPLLSGGGLACAGCHPEGRDDGIVWTVGQDIVQTPTLRGRLVPPFQWTGDRLSLTHAIARSVQRIGGGGVPLSSLEALAAYLERGLPPPPPLSRTLTPQEQRGRELFVGRGACAGCHDPARRYADGRAWALDELSPPFDTPSLRGVGGTAPYFHDGRYASLEELMEHPNERMGRIVELSIEERAALRAFLETL